MPYVNNTQSRKWQLTINNPADCELDRQRIIELLQLFRPAYFCMADEIATTGTYHTHVYLYSHSPIRFSTIKNRFPTAHIEKASGTSKENRDYIRKEGKWAVTSKAETCVPDTFFEFGELPCEAQEVAPKMFQLLQDVQDGVSTQEIIRSEPSFAFKSREIDQLRDTMNAERYEKENRDVKVYYLYGETGSGKTRGIYERHDPADVCRITDYGTKVGGVRFDAYHGQSVLVFEEFRSQIPIAAMLNYLDVYPLKLPARYSDRTACYTTVYITSNIPLNEQYTDIRRYEAETWKAFLRRIDTVFEYRQGGFVREVPIYEWN
jgi:hypothetical protein